MRNYLYLLFYFVNIFFIKSAESHINIVDNYVAQFFDSNWVNNIKNKRHTILVKMDKVKMPDGAYLDDYESTFEYETNFIHNGQDYKIQIHVKKDPIKKDHKLDYIIYKKGEKYDDITDENDEKIFYEYDRVDEKTNKNIYNKSPETTLGSYNWVLAKIKPKDEDDYFYVFINNIDHVLNGHTIYCCLGVNNNIEDFYFIYSKINYVDAISATLEGHDTQLVNINLKGLNFNEENIEIIKMEKWFTNAKSLKNITNIPKFNKNINIEEMVKGCKNLENVDLGENTINKASFCFTNCENLKNVNLENTSITENANLSNMFNHCKISKNLKGIKTLVNKNNKPNVDYMFSECNIECDLDLSKWGTNMKSYKYLFSKSNFKNLTLFNLKELVKKNKETIENNKKKIDEFYKKHPDKKLNEKVKSLILLNRQFYKEGLNAEDNTKLKNLENDDEIKKVPNFENYKKEFEDIINMENENQTLESPDILNKSTIENFNIKEDFMPDNKQDLDKILGDGYNITGNINIIKSNGEVVTYKNFDDYPYKEQEKQPNITNNPPQLPTNIEDTPKPNSCCLCCATCFSKCCCCCKRNV